jgi:D-alanine-D-alanine ligase
MRIAYAHNLATNGGEDEAELDRPETVAAIVADLRSLGHEVFAVEMSAPVPAVVRQLQSLRLDLVFNCVEGRKGRFREAFYPALFEQLGIPFTASDAYTCLLTLDKQLTKKVVAARGVPTPRSVYVERLSDFAGADLRLPVIIKPNFEGSSKGITQDSVIDDPALLEQAVASALERFPAGVLVEEYIDGIDVTVPYLEATRPETHGVLEPVEYLVAEEFRRHQRYPIYDYVLKNTPEWRHLELRVPALLSDAVRAKVLHQTAVACRALGIRDLGRCDFRVTPDGDVYFIECNALPSLEAGAGLYLSAAACGHATTAEVLDLVVRSAAKRYGLDPSPSRPAARQTENSLRVGFTYNVKRIDPRSGDDSEAEFDAPTTIQAVADAIAAAGHEVVRLEANASLPMRLMSEPVDVVFNMAEGFRGRSREAQVPALLEFFDIPFSGSDAVTMALTLDKSLAKQVVAQAGVPTANFLVMHTGQEPLPPGFGFPAVAKPLLEGSSKGVHKKSVVRSEDELRVLVTELVGKYTGGILVEEFLTGREFTVGILGADPVRVLAPMEIVFTEKAGELPVYSFEHKQDFCDEVRYEAPARVDPELDLELRRVARDSFLALGCRDVSRIDIRQDRLGRACFIECNPLPGLTPGWSDLCMIATAAGLSYNDLIAAILAPAIERAAQRAKKG